MRVISLRDNRGAAIIGLCLGLSAVLLAVAFFVFDMNRMQMAQRQLVAISDAAAMAGSAMLTSKDVSYEDSTLDTLYTTQLAAKQYARNMFAMGDILGNQIYDPAAGTAAPAHGVAISTATTATLSSPSANGVNLLIQLCSPIDNYAIVNAGNSSARAVSVQASYGYVPCVSFLGVTNVGLPSSSIGGLQKLLVIVVFDCSGSMDDNTVVSFVERRWTTSTDPAANTSANNNKGQYMYFVVGTPGATGQLWQYAGLDYTNQPNGTAVNVLPPQNLDYMGVLYENVHYNLASSNTNFDINTGSPPLAFDVQMREYMCWPAGSPGCYNSGYASYPYVNSGFQGPFYDNDFGTPPGNCIVKYGNVPTGFPAVTYGWSTANTSWLNVWDGNSAHAPGPGSSPGYYYASTGTPSSSNNDGYRYFYDPYSIPGVNTNAAYTAFTDLVVNIASPGTFPFAQPIYGPATFARFNYTFSQNPFYVACADTNSSTNSSSLLCYQEAETGPYALAGHNYNFSSIAEVVEASRGNMDYDNTSRASNYYLALLSYGSNLGTIAVGDCKYSYQKAYQRLAFFFSQPMATAVDGAQRFFQNLCGTSACVFGLVGFSVAPASTTSYNVSYYTASGKPGYYSLLLTVPAAATSNTGVYGSYVYEPISTSCNPNFWLTSPMLIQGAFFNPGEPAGGTAGTGFPYDATYNTVGPAAQLPPTTTSLAIGGSAYASNGATCWAFNNGGFQIPRFSLNVSGDSYSGGTQQLNSYAGVAGCNWDGLWTGNTGNYPTSGNGNMYAGYHGINHCRPLYDTDGLEALEVAIDNLTSISALNTLTGLTTGLSLPTLGPGSKKAIVFFTDGVPTDDTSPYTQYESNVVIPAKNNGIAIYSIGLALNSNIKLTQSSFLSTLANNGACGSQYFQITSNSNLASTFTGIARQLAQCQK